MSKQPMSAATSGECSDDEFFAGLNTDTIALDCEPVKVIYTETTITLTEADVPATGEPATRWEGSCPASHPIPTGGTNFYPATNGYHSTNRPSPLTVPPLSFSSGNRSDNIEITSWAYAGVTPFDFSLTVTFMTQCWLAPSTYGDTTNPTLFSASPADNETAVVAGKSIVLNFSENVDAETGNVTIYRTSDSTVVEAIDVSGSQVTGSGTSTITVNPADDLAYTTEYYVLIDATAFDDASSNSYAGISDITTLSFTTGTTPGVPTALAGFRGIGVIDLTWTAPSSNGGLAISDYVVEYSADGTTWTTFNDGGSSTASASVTGLANATTYTFRVSAVNAAGTGTASATASATTGSVPAALTGLIEQFVGAGGMRLFWTAPSNGDYPITSYVVEFSSDAGATWTTSLQPSTCGLDYCHNTIYVLVDGTAYLIRAAAVNAVGTGNFSENLSFTAAW